MLVTGFRTIYRILRLLVPKRIYQQLLGSPSVILRSLWKSKDSPQWGWKKLWDWGTPPTFGAIGSGKETCIFLCQGAQGGRGRGANTTTFQQAGDEEGDKGVWMSVWVDDVDEMHKQCVAAGLEVTFPPTDMPWHVREMHLRHPDGHVFRVGRGLDPKE